MRKSIIIGIIILAIVIIFGIGYYFYINMDECTSHNDCDGKVECKAGYCSGDPKRCSYVELPYCRNDDGCCSELCNYEKDNDCPIETFLPNEKINNFRLIEQSVTWDRFPGASSYAIYWTNETINRIEDYEPFSEDWSYMAVGITNPYSLENLCPTEKCILSKDGEYKLWIIAVNFDSQKDSLPSEPLLIKVQNNNAFLN